MENEKKYLPVEQLRLIMTVLDPCMDDYLYVMDLRDRHYEISHSAIERFRIPSDDFYFTEDILVQNVYHKDLPMLLADLDEIIANKKRTHDLEYRWMDKDGQPVWIICRGRVLVDENGNAEYLIGCINEIGCRQKADNVSGLIVASGMQKFLEEHSQEHGYLFCLDIDNFREINEKLGMEYGDMVLRDTAVIIESVLDAGQMLYHVVGDEFAVLDLTSRTAQDAHKLYLKIRQGIDKYVSDHAYTAFFTISAGILDLSLTDSHDYTTLITLAEFSLNESKSHGKNTDYLFSHEDYEAFLNRMSLMRDLRQAVNDDFKGFELHFQPVEDLHEHTLCSAEALLRFRTEERAVSPAEFIPLLEESGLIIPVGRWILSEAMSFCRKMQNEIPNFKVSVNVSYIQVLKSDLIHDIIERLKQYGLSADSIQIELTESGFFESDTSYIKFCEKLKELGISLALDDFGTGYSNFHYLYHIDPQVIKIDRSFTLKALNHEYEYNLLHHMIELTHSINSKLCIEGIETKEELDKICTLKPDYIQGYYFGKSYPGATFLAEYINR